MGLRSASLGGTLVYRQWTDSTSALELGVPRREGEDEVMVNARARLGARVGGPGCRGPGVGARADSLGPGPRVPRIRLASLRRIRSALGF